MTDSDLWNYLELHGGIRPLWWYTVLVVPAMIVSLCVYLLVWFTQSRRQERLVTMLSWLVVASLPALIILPSFYARLAIGDTLGYVGLERPKVVQDLAFNTTQQVGSYLSQLAALGLTGTLLAIGVCIASVFRGGLRYVPLRLRPTENPASRGETTVAPAISGVLTETFERRPNPRVSAPYGVIRVVSGQRKGTHFGIAGSVVIGKQKANLTINDGIVSRHHARLDIRNGSVYLIDLKSNNGTYLRRTGITDVEINGEPFKLQAGDTIFLGNPDLPQAVQLIYEQSAVVEAHGVPGPRSIEPATVPHISSFLDDDSS